MKTRSAALVLGLWVLFGWCSASQAQTKSIDLSYSTFFPAPHKMAVLATEWGKEVEKRTGGKIKVTVYPGGTLTPADKCYDGVVKGISDIGTADLAYTRGRFPLSEVFYLPLGYKSAAVASKMVNAFYKKFQPKELSDTKVLYLNGHGPGFIHTRKPVKTLEEMKGLKIRSTGMTTKIVSALGAAPVGMTMGEAYDALQKGVVEGVVAPVEALQGWKLGEVVKYTVDTYVTAYTSCFFVAMNKEKWNSIPPDLQKTIEQINEEWIGKTGAAWDEIDKSGKEFTLKQGNQFIPLSKDEEKKWTQALKPLYDDYLSSMKSKKLPGDEALKFCQDYLQKNQ